MTPKIMLYDTTFSVLEVPARLDPSAMRCFTDSVMGVLDTASAWTKLRIAEYAFKMGNYQIEHIFCANKDDHNRQ